MTPTAATPVQPAEKFGIRVQPAPARAGKWQRGEQFRRDPQRPGHWKYWRNEWPNAKAAQLRLDRYRELGFVGHVFEIQPKPSYPNATHYSENFTREELNCKGRGARGDCNCRGRNPSPEIQRELALTAAKLEQLRDEMGGAPLGVLSGYRCPVHNAYVGGASQSQHMTGKAADPIITDSNRAAFDRAAAKVFANGGRGKYPNGGRHVDRGPKRTW